MREHSENWTLEHAAAWYGIRQWGAPYFDLSDNGDVTVSLRTNGDSEPISLHLIARELAERGVTYPVLLRFSDILDDRIRLLNESFRNAMKSAGYQGQYRGIFPIKVNQQHQVIEEVCRFGARYHHGLEAGSKAELIAALAYLKDPKAYIICNGYKDPEFIDLALYARRLGLQTILVVEMPAEIPLILDRAEALGIDPAIGLRVKLATPGGGHWNESGGDRSVFGLNAGQLIEAVDALRKRDRLDCLELLHYHLGSQIPDINTIRNAVGEAARIYTELAAEGAPMGLLDLGGGLAVNYDGSHSAASSSRNYEVEEYCADVIEVVMNRCDAAHLAHPTLLTESGRATVAHYAVLLFDILDVSRLDPVAVPELPPSPVHEYTRNLFSLVQDLTTDRIQETYNDAVYYRDQVRVMFAAGVVSLRERGKAEQMFHWLLARLLPLARDDERMEELIPGLERDTADIYYGNFSLFQSLPDAWAIDQLFPVMPIHRLTERPDRMAVFADLTCDCDGKIDRFIHAPEEKSALPLHALKEDEDYVIGSFLVGAYQETLGDLHNLFGDTHVAAVSLDEEGKLHFSHEVEGDTVADVLSYVEYDPKQMVQQFRQLADQAVRQDLISGSDLKQIVGAYQEGMRGYTYFEG